MIMDTGHCLKCAASLKFLKKSPAAAQDKQDSVKVPVKPLETSYVMQIVSIGVRPDNVYEVHEYCAADIRTQRSI